MEFNPILPGLFGLRFCLGGPISAPPPLISPFSAKIWGKLNKRIVFVPFLSNLEKNWFSPYFGGFRAGAEIGPPGRIRGPDFLSGRGFVSFYPIQFWSTDLGPPIFGWFLHIFFIFLFTFFRWGDEIGPLGRIGCFVNFWSKFQFFFKNWKFSPNFFSAYHKYPKARKSHGVPLKCI